MSNANPSDPMDFLRNLWGGNGFQLPGMVTPTLDTDELEKNIRDLKTVEGWLRTNLSMLSMTIQNLEMQRTTITAVKTMSQMYADQSKGMAGGTSGASGASTDESTAQAAMWPWTMMQQMQETMKTAAADAANAAAEVSKATTEASKSAAARRKKTP